MNNNITKIEIPFLSEDFNLTDGHAYRKWSVDEENIINNSVTFFKTTNRQQQPLLEKEYIKYFLQLAQQTINFKEQRYLLCTSASIGIEIVANYLRLHHMSLTLSEPSFDNLADIFKRHDIALNPFSDEYFDKPEFMKQLKKIETDAICFVSPNNPTGNILTKKNFIALVNYCKENKKLLILDFCFRAYIPRNILYDEYKILLESGVHYILIEDTGKTWPTVELKVAFLTVSQSSYEAIYKIYTDLILHVSPFTVKLMTEFIKNSINDNLKYIHNIVASNRKTLYSHIENTILTPVEQSFMSVSWLKVNNLTGQELKKLLDRKNVHVLPGDYFYWSNHQRGKHYIRIALVRDTDVFEKAAIVIGKICKELI